MNRWFALTIVLVAATIPALTPAVAADLPRTPSPAEAKVYIISPRDGATVHGDAGGEWTLDENGEVDDIVFFASPRWLAGSSRRDPLAHEPTRDEAPSS